MTSYRAFVEGDAALAVGASGGAGGTSGVGIKREPPDDDDHHHHHGEEHAGGKVFLANKRNKLAAGEEALDVEANPPDLVMTGVVKVEDVEARIMNEKNNEVMVKQEEPEEAEAEQGAILGREDGALDGERAAGPSPPSSAAEKLLKRALEAVQCETAAAEAKATESAAMVREKTAEIEKNVRDLKAARLEAKSATDAITYAAKHRLIDVSAEALCKAVRVGDCARVECLLRFGAKVDQSWGSTPLHIASLNGHKDVVQLLLEAGATVDQSNTRGFTALHDASHTGHEGVVQLLLEAGATVDQSGTTGDTALHFASYTGHEGVVQLLLEAGATVDQSNTRGFTALHFASYTGHEGVVQLLLEAGATVDQSDTTGDTALHIARRCAAACRYRAIAWATS